jgi:glycosyltransferase involved in cell wall biosynthesis
MGEAKTRIIIPMKLLFVADGRSPIALNWIHHFVEGNHEVHLISLYPCAPDLRLASLEVIPIAFSRPGTQRDPPVSGGTHPARWIGRLATPQLRTILRQLVVPLRLPRAARLIQEITERIQPDLVHAMRIPYEGMAAALSGPSVPLLISIWGNDFTLHAPSTPVTARLTRQAMTRANALHTDCQRDARLALEWGFTPTRPLVVLPSGGGLQTDIFFPPSSEEYSSAKVINPRGMRAYVRNDTFFRAIPQILERAPDTRFLCPVMADEPAVLGWLERYGGAYAVDLLPRQTREEMGDLFRSAQVAISITTHDGTPNTLLEAMACGCYPVAGDLESIREWISPGMNGALVDPSSAEDLTEAILAALEDPTRRLAARVYNAKLIKEKAEYGLVMDRAEQFYREILKA